MADQIDAALPRRLLLIGCGNMGGAMLRGWLAAGLDPATFTVVDPYLDEVPGGVRLLKQAPDERFEAALLGFKPQGLDEAASAIAPVVEGALVLSLLAGVDLATLAQRFPAAAGIVRVMPNLSAALGKSPVALASPGLPSSLRAMADALIAPLGAAEWLEGEASFDLVTALVGSGPAFVYRFIDALGDAAARLGLPHAQAHRLALAMVEGAAALASQSSHSPAELARRVASPGGVTEAGLARLDEDRALDALIVATLRAARERGAEMGRAASEADRRPKPE